MSKTILLMGENLEIHFRCIYGIFLYYTLKNKLINFLQPHVSNTTNDDIDKFYINTTHP